MHLEATLDELRIVRRHHRAFYAILLAAPLEWLACGRPAGSAQLVGAVLFLGGVVGYRRAGRVLGPQLSPLVSPREPAAVVDAGPYRRVRHPMYRAELAMAFGAPLTLGAMLTVVLSIVFSALLLQRMRLEEDALSNRTSAYRDYAARTKRIIPHLY